MQAIRQPSLAVNHVTLGQAASIFTVGVGAGAASQVVDMIGRLWKRSR
jgi:hypothetical protein